MKTHGRTSLRSKIHQAGALTVELALASIVFLTLVLAVLEFGRVMFLYNNLIEATRYGARVATVCAQADTSVVKAKMLKYVSNIGLSAANISVTYPLNACSAVDCDPVTVQINNFSVPLSVPFVSLTFPLPKATTSVPSESLDSTNNAICQ
jgi:Flp pilus assembly protein TadG